MGVKKGDIIELELFDLANGGDCVGRYQGLAVFTAGGVPGETVLARIIEKKKSYARAEIVEIIKEAEVRIEPQCPVFGTCGGCQLQHIEYKKQLEYKRKIVKDSLERIADLKETHVHPVIAADYPFAYRNKAQFPLTRLEDGEISTGFFKQGTHQIVSHKNCMIQHPMINRIANRAIELFNEYDLSVYDEELHKGLLRHLIVRVGICTNQAILTVVTAEDEMPFKKEIAHQIREDIPEVVGVLQNINNERTNVIMGDDTNVISGRDYYIDYIGNIKYAISAGSFFQVNTLQTKKLYDQVKKSAEVNKKKSIIDTYCGTGSISLYLAENAGTITGIEVVEEAIINARKNAELNDINNCQFITAKVERKIPELISKGLYPDLIIFDPPRKGLDKIVIDSTLKAKPERIIYVSCNPATLARDLKLLKNQYQVNNVQPVDMFPQTYHIETVVTLDLM